MRFDIGMIASDVEKVCWSVLRLDDTLVSSAVDVVGNRCSGRGVARDYSVEVRARGLSWLFYSDEAL